LFHRVENGFLQVQASSVASRSGSKIKVEKQKTRNKKAKVGPKFEKLGRVECVFKMNS
jgi:hypothetical protein